MSSHRNVRAPCLTANHYAAKSSDWVRHPKLPALWLAHAAAVGTLWSILGLFSVSELQRHSENLVERCRQGSSTNALMQGWGSSSGPQVRHRAGQSVELGDHQRISLTREA